jgi:TolA-binding protein
MTFKDLRAILILAAIIGLVAGCGPADPDDHFQEAAADYDRGRFEDAVEHYRDYLAEHPDGSRSAEALYRTGETLYYALDRRAEAVKRFRRLVNDYPASDYAYRAREIMAPMFRDEIKDYQQAVLEFKWLAAQRPNQPKGRRYLYEAARCYLAAENYPAAILEFGRFLEIYPDSELAPQVYDEIAGAYMVLEQFDPAAFILSRLIQRWPDNEVRPAAEFKIAQIMEAQYRYAEAMTIYQSLLDRYENREAVEIRLAGVKQRRDRKQSEADRVDYGYRPEKKPKTETGD